MQPAGRPRFLNYLKRTEYCALLASGLTPEQAARNIGCALKTVRREAKRDSDFRQQITTARRSAAVDPIKLVRQAAGSHWRAAAWLLERTEPDRFGPRSAKSCRPEQVEDLVARLIEEALSAINRDVPTQVRVFQRLDKVAEEGLNTLFPGGRPPRRSRVTTLLTDDLRLQLELGLIRPAVDPAEGETPSAPPHSSERQPSAAQRSAARQPGKTSTSPTADNCPSKPEDKTDQSPNPFVPLFAQTLARKLQESIPPEGQNTAVLSPKIDSQEKGPNPSDSGEKRRQ